MADEWISLAKLKRMGADELRARVAAGPVSAAGWIEAGALNGIVNAQIAWGHMLAEGKGTRRDPAAALRWFSIAADAGNAEAANMVGRCHELGWGSPVDPARAAQFYRRAALAGDAWAQFNLAGLLLAGDGVPRDRRQALVWYARAARTGHAKSATMVGRYLEHGWDRPARLRAALRWYRRGAEGGDYRGRFDYGRTLIANGRTDDGIDWIRRSIEGAVPDFCRLVAEGLRTADHPILRALALRALERACESNAAADWRTYAIGLAEGLGGAAQPDAARQAFARARQIEAQDAEAQADSSPEPRPPRSSRRPGAGRLSRLTTAAGRFPRAIRSLLRRMK